MENKEKNKRGLLLALPLLVLPFLALAFYALGGGLDEASSSQIVNQGINTQLPDARLKETDPQDKLSLYEMTKEDSASLDNQFGTFTSNRGTGSPDASEQAVNEKLAQINQEINRPQASSSSVVRENRPEVQSDMKGDVDRLEKLMNMMKEGKTEDPEIRQLTGMLDKIMAIQNPGLIAQSVASTQPDSLFKAIPAIIVENQRAVQGASVKIRLQDSVLLNGLLIPKGQEIYGTCQITNQRLLLTIKNIRLGTSIIPVDLSVFSLDGMIGINAPEADLGDAAGGGATDAMRSIGLYGMDQSITTQVASAGIDAARNMLSRKISKVKVKLQAGQPVLLRNNKPAQTTNH